MGDEHNDTQARYYYDKYNEKWKMYVYVFMEGENVSHNNISTTPN
jgi:hypothetical protein